MDKKRGEYQQLNFYTTEQLVMLRQELAEYLKTQDPQCLKKSQPLLAMIYDINPDKLLSFLPNVQPMQYGDNGAHHRSDVDSNQYGKSLKEQLEIIWEKFTLEKSESSHDFLSIEHLGEVLRHIEEQKPKCQQQRELPSWLSRGRPYLLEVPADKVFLMVLSIYEHDADYTPPTRNEVLVCNKSTRKEEAKLFLDRALADPNSFYCMVNCHLLTYEVCRLIETRLSNTADDKVKDYGLAFICAAEKKDARIRVYLDKYLVKTIPRADESTLRKFVLKLTSVNTTTKTACVVDIQRSFVRLIRSERAGVGKSLHKDNLCSDLRARDLPGEDITIPIYKTVDTDGVMNRLTEKLGNGYTGSAYHTVHFDIAHEVESGVDELLFNLIILRSIVNSEGVVWQAQTSQYYIIECMPHTKQRKNVHQVLDVLPTTQCRTPQLVLNDYENSDVPFPEGSVEFDEAVFTSNEWQTVIRHLHCHEIGDTSYSLVQEPFRNKTRALELLITHCRLKDPTWSELRHYVFFLSDQLNKINHEKSTYIHHEKDLPGFKQFVITFMFRMAQDFATRSLVIAEETPGVQLQEEPDLLGQLKMKRTWESENHPYLFMNEDGATFTSLGFCIESRHGPQGAFSLIDRKTKEILAPRILPRDLKRILDECHMPMDEDFDSLHRSMKLEKLRRVMVPTLRIFKTESGKSVEEQVFRNDDPDVNYVLTMDNAKKILAIHQRLRVGIPVIIMGETGCGKTKLVEFMSKLQVPTSLKSKVTPMIIAKIHGGTTEQDIIDKVRAAEKQAIENVEACKALDEAIKASVAHQVYTILFLDEANTTEAIGLVKEILCDGRMRGEPLDRNSGLKIIAACNPYRKHSPAMIKKLQKAGLGYHESEGHEIESFGQIPMRHLVYRVQPLSQSLLPLVWDFGTLKSKAPKKLAALVGGDVENAYITQMIGKFNQSHRTRGGLSFGRHTTILSDILSTTQSFMRDQKDECSFVSLRDVQRVLDVAAWFYQQKDILYKDMDKEELKELHNCGDSAESSRFQRNYPARSLVLSLGVCYLARLEDKTREKYVAEMDRKILVLICGARDGKAEQAKGKGAEYMFQQLRLCQNLFIDEVIKCGQHPNIAKNKALKENVFMMIVCIQNKIPLFLVGKPGSSKSLSKAMVADAMKGGNSKRDRDLFHRMKETHMASFQCSQHATSAGIAGMFKHCANLQKGREENPLVAVVVLDELGLAEDSPNMPLKTLHPLLEDGCIGNETPEPYMKCGFVGISNWALDPAKMNRGIFVQRGTPDADELVGIAKEICQSSDIGRYIDPLAISYLKICEEQKPEERDLTEFFGLRDFYGLIKMAVKLFSVTNPNRNQLEHSIKRNFGGFDPAMFNPMEIFKRYCPVLEELKESDYGRPPVDPLGLIQSSLFGEDTQGMETRYLLILTEDLNVLKNILARFGNNKQEVEVVFGSRFKDDLSYTQVCHNIYRIKTCMAIGKPVILLNLDELYESLYDALNQYFSTLGNRKYVDIGLGTHRVKAHVHDNFRLVVIADKNKVHTQFPIPLINRLEKHYISATTLLNDAERKVKEKLEQWVRDFVTPSFSNVCPETCHGCKSTLSVPYRLPCLQHYVGPCCKTKIVDGERKCPVCNTVIRDDFEWAVDLAALENRQYFENCSKETAFVGYSSQASALAVLQSSEDVVGASHEELLERSKFHLLQCATGEAVLRLERTKLAVEAKEIQSTYMQHQIHDMLLEFLSKELQPSKVPKHHYIQVTSFAGLMNFEHMDELKGKLDETMSSVHMTWHYLKDFVKENQFVEALKEFYSQANNTKDCRLLIIQCESVNENVELLDSVRYIIQRESVAAPEKSTFTLLHLNLPRGRAFPGYQGGQWKCVHIEDSRSPEIKLPPLSKCLQLTPSQIIGKLITKVKEDTGPPPLEDEQVAQERGDYPDFEQMETGSPTEFDDMVEEEDEGMRAEILKFVMRCLPAALSIIKPDEVYNRVEVLRSLFYDSGDNGIEFTNVFMKHLYSLLKSEEKPENHWVTGDAAKASNMKQSETLRHALEDALERALVSPLAAIISFIDVRRNLQLMTSDRPLTQLWIPFFKRCPQLGLKLTTVTGHKERGGLSRVLTNSYRIREIGNSQLTSPTEFPFSWLVKYTIDNIFNTISNTGMNFDLESLVDKFEKNTVIGDILVKHKHFVEHEKLVDAYLKDFVYMAHPCSSLLEHEIVSLSISKKMRDAVSAEPGLVHVHHAYQQFRLVFDNLSTLVRLFGEGCNLQQVKQLMQDAHTDEGEIACDLLTLKLVLQSLSERDAIFNVELWVEKVERCKTAVTEVLGAYSYQQDEAVVKCRTLWNTVMLKRLYLLHVMVAEQNDGHDHLNELFTQTERPDGYSCSSELPALDKVLGFMKVTLQRSVEDLYNLPPDSLQNKCPGSCDQLITVPVRLLCKHVLCEQCSQQNKCPVKDCGLVISITFRYDYEQDNLDKVKLEALRSLRQKLNKFFMHFVTEMVFDDPSNPEEAVVKRLLNLAVADYVTHPNPCNMAQVVHPSPALRFTLLTNLLSCSQVEVVYEHLNGVLANLSSQSLISGKLQVDFMNSIREACQSDHGENAPDPMAAGDLGLELLNPAHQAPTQSVIYLKKFQSVVIRIIELAISPESSEENDSPTGNLLELLEDFDDSHNQQPRHFIGRYLLTIHGASYLKDNLDFLSEHVQDELENFTVPDVFAAFGGDEYEKSMASLDNVIATRKERVADEIHKFIKTSGNYPAFLLPVIFTRITRDENGGRVDREQILKRLRTEMEGHRLNQMLNILLDPSVKLPPQLDMQTARGVQFFMLVLNIYSCLYGKESASDLHPLASLIHPRDHTTRPLLPTMPDNQEEMETDWGSSAPVYRCNNGHCYRTSMTTQVDEETVCSFPDGCKGSIISRDVYDQRVFSPLDATSQTGHTLGSYTNRPGPHPVRQLTSLSCAVLRCLTHLCMYTASLFSPSQVRRIIPSMSVSTDDEVKFFVYCHMELDLQHIANCCILCTDDCILLLHDVINRMKDSGHGEGGVLATASERRRWEKAFDVKYIKPTFENQRSQLEAVKSKLDMTISKKIKELLSPEKRAINDNKLYASAALWDYKRTLTLQALQGILHSSVKNCPKLTLLVDNAEILTASRRLPDVLELVRTLNDRFHSCYSKKQAQSLSMEEFCDENKEELPQLNKLVDSFLQAWKIGSRRIDMRGGKPELTRASSLSFFLIDPIKNNSPAYLLVKVLTDVHNRMLSGYNNDTLLLLSQVNRFNTVGVHEVNEVLALVSGHKKYGSNDTDPNSYRWAAIEREVHRRYTSNKREIYFSQDQLPSFVYQENESLHNQMEAIGGYQEMLSTDLEGSVAGALPDTIPKLTRHLKELGVAINFLRVMSLIEHDTPLAEYMYDIFGRDAGYLSQEVKLKHIKHVCLIVKYTQTGLLMRNKQEPFDDVAGECREELKSGDTEELEKACGYKSSRTERLLLELFNYITLHLNKPSLDSNMELKQSLRETSLRQVTLKFVEETKSEHVDCDHIKDAVFALPENLCVCHAAKAWCCIWSQYTTPTD